jgi:phage tail tape-measure protein
LIGSRSIALLHVKVMKIVAQQTSTIEIGLTAVRRTARLATEFEYAGAPLIACIATAGSISARISRVIYQ